MIAQDLEQRARELLGQPYHEEISGLVKGAPLFEGQEEWVPFDEALRAVVAAIRQQLAPVDLEQFREAVEQWKMLAQVGETVEAMPVVFRKKPEEYTARIAEADRLLTLIDNAGKVECAKPAAWQFLPKGGGDSNWVTVPSPEPWREKGLPVRPLYAHQPAPVVGELCQECGGSGDYCLAGHSAHPNNWRVCEKCSGRGRVAAVPVVDDAMVGLFKTAREMVETVRAIPESALLALDSDPHPPSSLSVAADELEAALARAQGVQS